MDRRSFLKLLGSAPFLALPLPSLSLSSKELLANIDETTLTAEEATALQKIKTLEAQLVQQKEGFSWQLHNELRHYWGVFSENKSLSHANIILENSIMDTYIMNTLSDWHYAPETQARHPDLALASLQRRIENYPDYYYVKGACLLRAGEIKSGIGDRISAQDYFQQVVEISEKFQSLAPRLLMYKIKSQELIERL